MHIDHINISAPSDILTQEKDFFCQTLGLKVGFRPNLSSNGYWLYSGSQALLHLVESNDHYPSEQPGYLDHVAFTLTGLERLLTTLETLSTKSVVKYLAEMDTTQVFFKSPAGIGLEAKFIGERQLSAVAE